MKFGALPECKFCLGGVRKIFNNGEKTIVDFIAYAIEGEYIRSVDNVIAIAHNSKSFDCQFILKALVAKPLKKVRPDLILSGTKKMVLSIGKVKFIDSFNYFNMSLSKLPRLFGLEQHTVKGFFPHYFNREENQTYDGPYPAKEFYGFETMRSEKKSKFEEWYNHQVGSGEKFNFRQEMEHYCDMDVTILRKACLVFRKIFMDISGLDPFVEASTMAGACTAMFRAKFLQEKTIGIIPTNGYRKSINHSKISLKWLYHEEQSFYPEIRIAHEASSRERYIPELGTTVDGYREIDGVGHVYEFQGCFYYGHQDAHCTLVKINDLKKL